jgi:hypothetical protein
MSLTAQLISLDQDANPLERSHLVRYLEQLDQVTISLETV